ncbi:MAG: TonB-dependent receptor [Acidobacteria bacterium]|nr:TonB-dependent receptor [Acidobacteriota bacterium]
MTRNVLATIIGAVLGVSSVLHAGEIRGKVVDAAYGDDLIAVAVSLGDGAQVVFTDVNGAFRLVGLDPGTYSVTAAMDGFRTVTVTDVVVNKDPVVLELAMELDTDLVEALVVTAELLEDSEAGLLRHRQKSSAISDAISSEMIARSGGGNAADAMTRVVGASVVGSKYVYVRGLGDRYTTTHLNGVELPTADPDSNAFPADLFPSNVLESIVTQKTFTPEKPGNFSGGLVDIGTPEYPSSFTMNISLSSSYNTSTTLKDDFLTYDGSGSDWLGRDDGLRALPSMLQGGAASVPDLVQARQDGQLAQQLDAISRSFEPVMAPSHQEAPLNEGMSVSLGNQRSLGDMTLGYLTSLSYSRKYEKRDDLTMSRWKLTDASASNQMLTNQSDFVGEYGEDTVAWGGILNLNLMLNASHQIGFNTIYNQNGESISSYAVGRWPEQFSSDNAFLENRVMKYAERNLTSFQLTGEHYLGFQGAVLSWSASSAKTSQDEPDTRIFTNNYSNRVVNGEPTQIYSIAPSIYSNPARYFRSLEEKSENLKMDVVLPFEQWEGLPGKLKVGLLLQNKERSFDELRYEYVSDTVRYDGDAEHFFGPENVGLIGFDETTGRYQFGNVIQLAPDSRGGAYDGSEDVQAGYVQLELPFSSKWKLITGLRHETTQLDVYNEQTSGSLDEKDWLPALHFLYAVTDRMNVRASYGRTLARPTFREKAPYASYDFLADGIFVGNPDLKRTIIDNFDIRWEWFKGAEEVYAVSAFYKDFTNPIERAYNIRFASEFGEQTYLNVPSAQVKGIEFEVRHRFDQLVVDRGGSSVFSVSANVTLIDSEVDIPDEEYQLLLQFDPEASPSRELQGQSPYIINLGTHYDHIDWGTSASIFYNVFGERLDQVGVGAAPSAFEQPRDSLDVTFSQRIYQDFRLKITAKNLLDAPVEVVQSFKGQDYIQRRYTQGRSFSLSFSFKP